MKDRIESWASLVVGGAVVVLLGWLTLEQIEHGPRRDHARVERDGGESTNAAADEHDAGLAALGDGGLFGAGGFGVDSAPEGGLGLSLTFDGGMPSGAPRSVRLGVVLVQFAGAEGASSSARAKPDALRHAQELAEQARGDWKSAIRAGDSGSSEDIGRIPRGVLDARTEIAVFSLAKDDVSEPLETPRGYWIVKRVE